MTTEPARTDEVRNTINDLIHAGTTFDISALEQIYHNDMKVTMIDMDGNVNHVDKAGFKGLFKAKKAEGAAPLNTWAEYNAIDVQDNKGHVLMTRKVNLTGEDQKLVLSIDLIQEDDRWQVTREVIFVRPDA